ncbi:MAG: heme lyase CcmF/NrfE family subunit [Alphaproteobacteria bacterium]
MAAFSHFAPEIGLVFLWLAAAFGVVQGVAGGWNVWHFSPKRFQLLRISTLMQLAFLSLCLLILGWAYVSCQFSFLNVFSNNHTHMPWFFRLGALWGNYEGSLLLGCWMLSLFAALLVTLHQSQARTSTAVTVQGLITLSFLCFMIVLSHPFEPFPLEKIPSQGLALNPLLQDPSLLAHPPTLYFGYLGFSVPFSWSLAFMLHQNASSWVRLVRPWALLAWSFLTLGIGWGSWWAYYELGWGGWWFWDPVENASLMPWLVGTAMLHVLRSGSHPQPSFFLRGYLLASVLAFSLCLLGIYLTRAGVLSSVHSFAYDPAKGFYLFLIFASFSFLGFGLLGYSFVRKRGLLYQSSLSAFLSYQGGLKLHWFIFVGMALMVLLGTFFPLGYEGVTGKAVALDPSYFTFILFPFASVALLVMPLVPFLTEEGRLSKALAPLSFAATLALGSVLLISLVVSIPSLLALVVLSLGAWVLWGTSFWAWRVIRQGDGARLGALLAHAGVGITFIGLGVASFWRVETEAVLPLQGFMQVGPYALTLTSVDLQEGKLFDRYQARLKLRQRGRELAILKPEKRLYHPQESLISETALYTTGLADVYTILEEAYSNKTWKIKAMYLPLAPWIWIGCFAMLLGGLYSFGYFFKSRKPVSYFKK